MRMTTRALLAQSLYNDVVGLQVDYENGAVTRLAAARGRNAGADFDCFAPFGGRRRCCAADNGTVNAFYGEAGYTEDGANGQVMVYQPRFYYRVEPLAMEPQASGTGYRLKKANYYISPSPKPGFKRHPAFYGENGAPVGHILFSAYEASYYSAALGRSFVDGTDTDGEIGDGDRLCSLPGKKPVSGTTKPLTREAAEALARTRGGGWHIDTIRSYSANLLLMMVEYGTMNLQNALGKGVTDITGVSGVVNCASLTGSTQPLGNASGMAAATVNEISGQQTVYTNNGQTAIAYRGLENPWGNLWKVLGGVNLWGDGTLQGGMPYICADYDYEENKRTGNYLPCGVMMVNENGFTGAMGYSPDFDWLFVPAQSGGAATGLIGDYQYMSQRLNGYRLYRVGGEWNRGFYAGPFAGRYLDAVTGRARSSGFRLLYLPSAAPNG